MKDVPGYENRYAVTPEGCVWSYEKRSPVGTNGGVRVNGNRWLKLHEEKAQSGKIYHRVVLIDAEGTRKQWLVHRLVGIAYLPNPQKLPFINHINGDTTDNRVDNLEWCSPQENTAHAYVNGWVKQPNQKGEANSQAKVTTEQVKQVRLMSESGLGDTAIALQTGISRSAVKGITKYRTWKEVA
jgi:hypothetical protein